MQERFNTTGDSPGNFPESLRRSRVLSAMRTSRRLSIDGWVRLAPWRWRMFASEALPIPKKVAVVGETRGDINAHFGRAINSNFPKLQLTSSGCDGWSVSASADRIGS